MPIQVLSKVAWIEDQLRALYLPHIKYTSNRAQSSNAQVVVEYASDMSHINASVVTPVNGYEYVRIPLHDQVLEGMVMGEPVSHPQWHFVMDNTHFSIGMMNKVIQGQYSKFYLSKPFLLRVCDYLLMQYTITDLSTCIYTSF